MKFTKYLIFILVLIFSTEVQANPLDVIKVPAKKIFSLNNKRSVSRITGVLTKGEKIILRNTKKQKIGGRVVRTRDSNIDVKTRDGLGRTNCDRMSSGLAPIGIDGKPIALHHLKQKNDGDIVEVLSSEHSMYYKDLHSYNKDSEIQRPDFDRWRTKYWKERGLQLCR